jgi:ABC-type lipoprotein release transport system permease subunit
MISKIAWRNVWRSPARSLVVIGAIVLGVWALVFTIGFVNSWVIKFVENSVSQEYSNFQIHEVEFKKDSEMKFFIPEGDKLLVSLQEHEGVIAVTGRMKSNAMISSPKTATGGIIYGIEPSDEAEVTRLDSAIVDGYYFDGIRRNPILIGSKLAKKLKVKVRSKVVVTLQDINGDITAASFQVAGIFEVMNPISNESKIYVRRSDLSRIVNLSEIHEIAGLTNPSGDDEIIIPELKENYSGLQVEGWKDLAPELDLMLGQVKINVGIILGIIMVALGFGIVNSMLMAVLERFKEIGMLKAVGMKGRRVFYMIVMETIFMALVGGPIGCLLGYITIEILGKYGLDLSRYSKGLAEFGIDVVLYPAVTPETYPLLTIGVVITALVATLYPARKAVKLKTIEALHKI